jgi:hypothetical protein
MKTALFALAALVGCGASPAADRPLTLAETLTEEYAACAAYYQFVAVDLARLGKDDSAADARAAADTALQYAAAAQENQSGAQARATARTRMEFYVKGIARHIDRKAGNISLLAGKPGLRCRHAIEAPAMFRDELAQALAKRAVDP